jgi:tRNA pseudouridine55 synthase
LIGPFQEKRMVDLSRHREAEGRGGPVPSLRGARKGDVAIQLDGVLLLDKPIGPSSTRVLSHVKKLFNAKKAGHGGTLDPMASGLLPIMFGEATKYAADGLDADKIYEATIRLGVKTTTGDAEGDVIATADPPSALDRQRIEAVLAQFIGEQQQLPPLFSALKKDGKPLYAYARAGKDVAREPRIITIHELRLLSVDMPLFIVRVHCSKGTYVRTLAEDIGAALGLPAHLQALRRVGVGRLVGADMVALEFIESANINDRIAAVKPVDWLLRELPELELDSGEVEKFRHGQKVKLSVKVSDTVSGTVSDTTRVRVKNQSGVFLGTGLLDSTHSLTPERVRVLPS